MKRNVEISILSAVLGISLIFFGCTAEEKNPDGENAEAANLSQEVSSENEAFELPKSEDSQSLNIESENEASLCGYPKVDDMKSGEEKEAAAENLNKAEKEPEKEAKYKETRDFWTIREDMVNNVNEFKKVNPDTVGWLYLWDTTIDSPVFQKEGDNDYYLKHDDFKQEDKNGALVSDFNNILTGRDSQSKNLVIYGHSKDEDPDGGVEASREFEHFTELKRWQDIEFCKTHPYFLFATEDESEVFEVFAAFHTKTDFSYNIANPTKDQQRAIIDEALKRSLFNFNVEVNENDRIMTLSTCCRRIVPSYPNGWRFVVMGRLVEKGKLLDYERNVEINPTAVTKENIY